MSVPSLGTPIRLEDIATLDLAPDTRRRVQAMVAEGPDGLSWRLFLDRLALLAGAVLALAGVICFFAFNWWELNRFAKFGLVAAGMAACAGLALKRGLDRLAGKVILGAACVLAGVWFAVIGQVYQTGADAFELFRAWALVVLAWVILARSQGLWAFWMLLLNLWLGFWWDQAGLEPEGLSLVLSFMGLNGAAWLLREYLQDRLAFTKGRWFPRLLVLPALGVPVVRAVAWIVDHPHRDQAGALALGLALGLSLTLVGLFRSWRRDLFMVTAGLAAGITLLTTALGKGLLGESQGCGPLLVVGLILVGQVAGAAAWLRSLNREAK